jgi:hypothetical protein
MENTIAVSKKPVGGINEGMDECVVSERDENVTESISAKLKAAFGNHLEREAKDAIKIDSGWKYERTWTRIDEKLGQDSVLP